ncbi:hypothetical protein ABZP36_016954 [Zizania latifolia]
MADGAVTMLLLLLVVVVAPVAAVVADGGGGAAAINGDRLRAKQIWKQASDAAASVGTLAAASTSTARATFACSPLYIGTLQPLPYPPGLSETDSLETSVDKMSAARAQSEEEAATTEVVEGADLGIVGDDTQVSCDGPLSLTAGVETVRVFPKNAGKTDQLDSIGAAFLNITRRKSAAELAEAGRPVALTKANATLGRVDLFCELAGASIFAFLLSKNDPLTCIKLS